MDRRFPENFFFGSSTSAHQIEGGLTNNWSYWSNQKVQKGENHEPAGNGVKHFELYRKDYRIAEKLGHDALRISIPWSRVAPKPDSIRDEVLNKYRQRILLLRELGIEPIVTLWHFSHPIWFMRDGGWVSGDVRSFLEFTEAVVEKIGDLVKYWIPFNEPQGFAWMAYGRDWWPPELDSKISYIRAKRNFINAHKKVYRQIKERKPSSRIGIAKSTLSFLPSGTIGSSLVKRVGEYLTNDSFIYRVSDELDFLGVNYYFHREVGLEGESMPDGNKMNPPFPSKIGEVVRLAWEKHGLPIMITETGTADEGKREWYIEESLKPLMQCLDDGIPVKGYLYWTLLDCFEWHSGWDMNFGMVEVDRKDYSRKVRDFARYYSEICASKEIR